jgi:hypothetical protein
MIGRHEFIQTIMKLFPIDWEDVGFTTLRGIMDSNWDLVSKDWLEKWCEMDRTNRIIPKCVDFVKFKYEQSQNLGIENRYMNMMNRLVVCS